MTQPNFHKILVANRGEIALRVMRTAHALGYRTVAVYSTADARARHVLEADEAVCIGEPLPAQSYLRIEALLDAARRTGADAVHPGYGFLAENAGFAQACCDAGLVFIGSSAEAIRAMGDKAGAKRRMAAAGVPCIPGYQGEDQGAARLLQEAAGIGYPVMVKATAGGGGRGMRLVEEAAQFEAALQSAQSEARNAFGDATVILERAVTRPRHIEIQVFADRFGNVVHLGERDCSVQRRHQKLIEETPSPAVGAALRARMGEVAVAAVRAIGYEGAGTLEFLLDAQGNFFFMEMNTRLQVEHPVTEAITGLDLVEWQLRVAAGEPLPLRQEDIGFDGHAIEVRLCAEDAQQGFLPQSGTMVAWHMPAALRVEHALAPGAEVPPYYDSMIAKLVAHGRTREEARRKLLRGLHEAVALGVTTNQSFLARCLADPVFVGGGATTAFIAEQQAALLATDEVAHTRMLAIAAWLLAATDAAAPPAERAGILASVLPRQQHFQEGGLRHVATLWQRGTARFEVQLADAALQVLELASVSMSEARIVLDGVMEPLRWHRAMDRLWLHYRGRAWTVEDLADRPAERRSSGGDGRLRASMNGRVVAVAVQVGDHVRAGDPLLTLEAMKMEHVHVAPATGTVLALHAAVGDQVQAQRVVAEVTPEGAAGA